MTREQAMFDALSSSNISWTMHEHEAVFTVEASAELHEKIRGAHTKNLFLKDAAGQFWLVTAPHDARIDLKQLPGAIGSKKVSFGKAEDMERLLGITPGSVTPLAAFNDLERNVNIVLDARLSAVECINVHPLRNTATISLSSVGLISLLKQSGHDPLIVALPEPSKMLDKVIETTHQAGLDMRDKYKETSKVGLAENAVE